MTTLHRRSFLKKTGLGAGGLLLGMPAIVRGRNLNEQINVACVGVGGKGSSDVNDTAKCDGVNIVALCDVDSRPLDSKAKKFPDAKKYIDYRKMLTEMGDKIDAVVISTPDHMHGIIASMAMNMGKHIYCQKPLTQTVAESRALVNLAKEKNLATQMGNQGSANDGLRRAVEVIQAGVIGNPLELHAWTNRPVWPQGIERPSGSDPVPDYLDWDLWQGVAAERPYVKDAYHRFNWRGWYDYGTGALGDMACHIINMPFRALKLGYPSAIECELATRIYPETFPLSSRIRFDFPERDGLPPLKFWWYDGNPKEIPYAIRPYPDVIRDVMKVRNSFSSGGSLIIGEKGQIFSPDDYGAVFLVKLNGEERFVKGDDHPACKEIAQSIPRSPGHNQEWIDMIKGGAPTYSNFEIAGYLTEIILLGCIALRVGEGVNMEWDGPNMNSPSHPEAAQFVKREIRQGW